MGRLTIRVHGADELRRLAKQCRDLGRRDLVNKLYRGFNRAVQPFEREVRAELGAHTPGDYTGVLDGSLRIRASVKTVGSGVGISVVGIAHGQVYERDLPAVDAGIVRHPLFGDRSRWFNTYTVPGFFTGPPADRMIGRVEDAAELVIEEVADELERG